MYMRLDFELYMLPSGILQVWSFTSFKFGVRVGASGASWLWEFQSEANKNKTNQNKTIANK